ncbi:Alkylglycerol monooxygenase [Chionoecetes opilio]|uniref:Alkylglycerol monooxygenase n=1 Tax=Chionoecetes opilio TaxID=41210 RepID=A0A8J4XQW1_CHIOP|nr:Alkylglycerol monooxygenase [Chionoecetes opilio]
MTNTLDLPAACLHRVVVVGISLGGYEWRTTAASWIWIGPRRSLGGIGGSPGPTWLLLVSTEPLTVNLVWSSHQVHHSSEDYNFSTALRQSLFQRYFSLGFYQPLALLGVPLPALMVHLQFNLIFQFWIHTQEIDTAAPWSGFSIPRLTTASTTVRTSGASNKNYAGVLINLDRLFPGTFQAEKRDEKIAFGLGDQPQTLNVMWMQSFSWLSALAFMAFMFVSAGIIGAMYDGWWWAPLVEAARCVAYIAYARSAPVIGYPPVDAAILAYFAVSALVWTSQSSPW